MGSGVAAVCPAAYSAAPRSSHGRHIRIVSRQSSPGSPGGNPGASHDSRAPHGGRDPRPGDRCDRAGRSPAIPGLPMGMADVATALWTRFHKFDAADPRWPDRDRFVLSAGHGSMLLYALIYLTGHDGMSIDDIRQFRQIAFARRRPSRIRRASGDRDHDRPAGSGFRDRRRHGDRRTQHGGALRQIAGGSPHLGDRLGRRHDGGDQPRGRGAGRTSGAVEADGPVRRRSACRSTAAPSLSYSDDVLKRFSAYGWATKRVDGHDPAQINAALSFAVRSKKPTLIACRTSHRPGRPGQDGNQRRARSTPGSARGRRARKSCWAGTNRPSPRPAI